jgi:hypothetical protein
VTDIGAGTPVGGRPATGGGGMNLKNLMKDRRFQFAAVGVVGVAGAVWYLRRNPSTNAVGATAAAGAQASRGYVQGGADTTGTDIASFLGSWGAQQNQALQAYIDSIKNTGSPAGTGVGGQPNGYGTNPLTWAQTYQQGLAGKYVEAYVKDRGYTGSWADIAAANKGTVSADPNAVIPYGVQFIIPTNPSK